MITTELKDKILNFIIENQEELYVEFDGEVLAPTLETNPKYIAAIVKDLANRGMLEMYGYAGYATACHLAVKIFDFYKSGGYAFEDHIIDGNIMKLKLEIEALEANIGKPQFDKMMSLVMGAIGGFALISGKT